MKIMHYTGEYFKIVTKNKTIAYNPPSKKSKLLNKAKSVADVVISSMAHPDFDGWATFPKDTFTVRHAGEYEIGDVFIHGIETQSAYEKDKKQLGQEHLINRVYAVTADEINMLFLGALSSKDKMDYKIVEDLESVDILFVPIGGGEVLSPQEAYSLAVSLEAKLIVPMHFAGLGSNSALGEFLQEAGQTDVSSVDKFSVRKKDLLDKRSEVVVIQS